MCGDGFWIHFTDCSGSWLVRVSATLVGSEVGGGRGLLDGELTSGLGLGVGSGGWLGFGGHGCVFEVNGSGKMMSSWSAGRSLKVRSRSTPTVFESVQ